MKNHRLYGMRCYLSGPMDRVKDHGEGWRKGLTPFLEKMGVIVLDPCHKPINIANELENRERRTELKKIGDYDTIAKDFRTIRIVDLRMVDMSDFLIVRLDTDIHACGTYEEISWANRMKRPILIWCVQGKIGLPDWLWGMIPQSHVFGTEDDLKKYLRHVHSDDKTDDLRRWIFFDYAKITPKVTVEQASEA